MPFLAVVLLGCSAHDLWPKERLDPKTAVHLTIMAEPWVYAHDVPMLAANARDYLNIGVVETNRAGKRDYWLGVVAWSTIDRSGLGVPAPLVRPGRVTLAWQATTLELHPAPGGLSEIGTRKAVFAEAQAAHADAWYRLSKSQLAGLAKLPPASVSLALEGGESVVYVPWHIDPRAMDLFLEATGFAPGGP